MERPARYAELLGRTRECVALGRFDAAATACREAIACAPERAGPYGVLALTLVSAGRLEEAAAAAEAARTRAPGDTLILNLSASIALRQGLPELAQQWSRAALARDAHDQRALADLAFASAASDAAASDVAPSGAAPRGAAGLLLDLPRLVRVSAIAAPAGYASVEAFNRALAAAVLACAALGAPAADAPLVGGRRLPDFLALDPIWSAPLLEAFRAAVADYLERLAVDPLHPVRTGRPAGVEFVGWANVMSAGDFERPHIHEGGWLSGVYYVETPAVAEADAAADPPAGALLLGGHHCEGALRSALIAHRPRAGELVVFPSYLCHRTVPFTGSGRRISIAFDVLRGPVVRRAGTGLAA